LKSWPVDADDDFIRNADFSLTNACPINGLVDQDHMSDLKGLEDAGIYVDTLIRNPSYTSDQMWAIKRAGGPLTSDAQWYVNACGTYSGGLPVIPFD
jgi:hypothetical protein